MALVRPESLQPSVQRGTRTQNDRLGPCPRRSVRIWPPRLIPISTNSEHSAWGPPSLLATTAYQRSTSAFGCKRSARFGPPPPAEPGQARHSVYLFGPAFCRAVVLYALTQPACGAKGVPGRLRDTVKHHVHRSSRSKPARRQPHRRGVTQQAHVRAGGGVNGCFAALPRLHAFSSQSRSQ